MPGCGTCSHTEEGPCGQWAEGPGARAKLHAAWTGPHRSSCAASQHAPGQLPSLLFASSSPQGCPSRGSSLSLSRTVCDTRPVRPIGHVSSGGPGNKTEVGGLQALRNLEWGMVPLITSPSKGPSFSPLLTHRGLALFHSKWWLSVTGGLRGAKLCGKAWTGDVTSLSFKSPI